MLKCEFKNICNGMSGQDQCVPNILSSVWWWIRDFGLRTDNTNHVLSNNESETRVNYFVLIGLKEETLVCGSMDV